MHFPDGRSKDEGEALRQDQRIFDSKQRDFVTLDLMAPVDACCDPLQPVRCYGKKSKIHKGEILSTKDPILRVCLAQRQRRSEPFSEELSRCVFFGFAKRIPADQTASGKDSGWFSTGAAGILRYRREPGHTMSSAAVHAVVLSPHMWFT